MANLVIGDLHWYSNRHNFIGIGSAVVDTDERRNGVKVLAEGMFIYRSGGDCKRCGYGISTGWYHYLKSIYRTALISHSDVASAGRNSLTGNGYVFPVVMVPVIPW